MDVSVIVVAYNEEKNIIDCLDSLVTQNYTSGKYEIIVVDGFSQDRTPDYVNDFCQRLPWVRMVRNEGRTIASNRNAGVQAAQYGYVAFTDADCVCPENWLESLAQGYVNLQGGQVKIGAVGGGNTVDSRVGVVPDAIALAFNSSLSALGSVQTKLWPEVKQVESLACLNAFYDKRVIYEVGLFDERLRNSGEDWDLNHRIRKAGYSLFYLPDVTVHHKMRPNLVNFVKQMYSYGSGRARLIRKDFSSVSWKYVLPLTFLLIMLSFIVVDTVHRPSVFLILPFYYFLVIFLHSLYIGLKKNRIGLSLMMTLIYFIIHFVYSTGLLVGLLRSYPQFKKPKKVN